MMRPLLATCTVYTWLIGRVSTVTSTVDTRLIVEFFVVIARNLPRSFRACLDALFNLTHFFSFLNLCLDEIKKTFTLHSIFFNPTQIFSTQLTRKINQKKFRPTLVEPPLCAIPYKFQDS
jgi:hypothetical protein